MAKWQDDRMIRLAMADAYAPCSHLSRHARHDSVKKVEIPDDLEAHQPRRGCVCFVMPQLQHLFEVVRGLQSSMVKSWHAAVASLAAGAHLVRVRYAGAGEPQPEAPHRIGVLRRSPLRWLACRLLRRCAVGLRGRFCESCRYVRS